MSETTSFTNLEGVSSQVVKKGVYCIIAYLRHIHSTRTLYQKLIHIKLKVKTHSLRNIILRLLEIIDMPK